jgi:large subunit ribosomal protein L21
LDVYAVVESGGKQYRVEVGQSIQVDRLPYGVGDKIELDKVLLVADESGVRVGQPHLEGATVHATVTLQDKYRKILVFRYRPKKRIRRKTGHRQDYTRLHIDEIVA